MTSLRIITVLILLAMLAGCGGSKVYRQEGPKNLSIVNDVDISFPKKYEGTFHVYKVKPDCSDIEHLGHVKVQGEKELQISLPTGQLLMLEMAFAEGYFGGGWNFIERRETLFRAKKGEQYKYDFYYRNKAIDVNLYRTNGKKQKKLPMVQWSEEACKKLM